MRRFCPHCGRVVPDGARCPCRPRPKRRATRGDGTRADREPWRREYSSEAYRRARQEAIARTGGRCAACGRVCAWWDGGRWRCMGGEVHHVVALSEGGTSDPSNLALMCRGCHARADEARRRAHRD